MTLQILGAGFGRTGTLSLKLAIEHLGFGPCHHMSELRRNPSLISDWLAAGRGEPVDWDAMFVGYASQLDWPGSLYWRELHNHFPDAKVILTIREPQAWFDSINATLVKSATIGRHADSDPISRSISELAFQSVYSGLFGGRMDDRDYAIQVHEQHVAEVVNAIPADQLLVFDVKDSWQPLCDFLGVERPDAPFPKANSTEDFLKSRGFLPG